MNFKKSLLFSMAVTMLLGRLVFAADVVFEDFEKQDYGQWQVSGDAFGKGPAQGVLPNQQDVSGFLGKGLLNSFNDGDQATGYLTSPTFTIEKKYIKFLVGGGSDYNKNYVCLSVGDEICLYATGRNSEKLEWITWDVEEYIGKQAIIMVVDINKNPWGHILIDQVTFSDESTGIVIVSPKAKKARSAIEVPVKLAGFIKEMVYTKFGNFGADVKIDEVEKNLYHVVLNFKLDYDMLQDDWQFNLFPNFQPTFNWAPHLTPTENNIIDQHVFRSPALIVSTENKQLVLVPDLDIMKKGTPVRWYMDMDAINNKLTLGMSNYKVNTHVLFIRQRGAQYKAGEVTVGFYLFVSEDKEDIKDPWRKPLAFMWDKWGKKEYDAGLPLKGDLSPYIKHTYDWAFKNWPAVWQEFEIEGKKVGAPVFIVNNTQSPNYPGKVNEREFRSIWNQAWFSSLRSASGLYRYAKRTKNNELLEKAKMTKELALLAPMKDGMFNTLIATEMEKIDIDGKKYNRSKGWETYYWGNSNRNPINRNAKLAPYHVLDMSWTCLLMLRWYDELEKDKRLLDYSKTYADGLLKMQDEKGYFPAWLSLNTLKPMGKLDQSPETSMSITFLLKLYEMTKEEKYKEAALKALKVVSEEIVPVGRWEDFETYWSCCGYGVDHLGRKFERNNMFKQCTLSSFWTTEALYEAYKVTKEKKYLELGQRVLDELLMSQASWQPPYMYVNVLGGFGVMNCDGEWLDSRESLFAEVILNYGKELKNEEYTQRGLAALRSGFGMLYCPENPRAKAQWEKVYKYFGPADYGFTMENYAHGGTTSPQGGGMGDFTIYDWGNGAAAEAYNRIVDHFGEDFVTNK